MSETGVDPATEFIAHACTSLVCFSDGGAWKKSEKWYNPEVCKTGSFSPWYIPGQHNNCTKKNGFVGLGGGGLVAHGVPVKAIFFRRS